MARLGPLSRLGITNLGQVVYLGEARNPDLGQVVYLGKARNPKSKTGCVPWREARKHCVPRGG